MPKSHKLWLPPGQNKFNHVCMYVYMCVHVCVRVCARVCVCVRVVDCGCLLGTRSLITEAAAAEITNAEGTRMILGYISIF